MASEIINKVLEAEKQSVLATEKATHEAQEIKSQANVKAKELLEKEREKALENAKKIIDSARVKAEEIITYATEKAEGEAQEILSGATSKSQQAIDTVLKEIIG